MNRAKQNYYVDTVIGIAFLFAGISALVFLIPTDWINFTVSTTPTVLGINFGVWQSLHKWAGIVLILGVVLHQLLHWKWITSMTQKIFRLPKRAKRSEANVVASTPAAG